MQKDSHAPRDCSLDNRLGTQVTRLDQGSMCLYVCEPRRRGKFRGWIELVKNLLFDFKPEFLPKSRNGTRLSRVKI
jgi:hypothetical protein